MTILESGIELNTNGEIIKKWNWNGKEYYVQHVKIIQIKIDKIHGDAIGGKEVEGERSIATLTQSVGIPIYDKDLYCRRRMRPVCSCRRIYGKTESLRTGASKRYGTDGVCELL